MNKDIKAYNNRQLLAEKEVCNLLSAIIGDQLPESTSKIWHANPVWFLDANPKDASIFYNNAEEINSEDLIRWLQKSKEIQWDYKNIVKNKGRLLKLK